MEKQAQALDQEKASNTLPIAVLAFCAFAVTTAEFVISGILPEVAQDLGVTISSAGQLVTAYAIGMILGGPVLTILTARLDRKRLMVGLPAVFIAGNCLAALSPNYLVLLGARFLSGLAVATFFALAIVAAASLAAVGKQASAIAQVALGFNLAMILGAPLGTLLGQQFGWRITFVAIASMAIVGALLLIWLVRISVPPATGPVLKELRVVKLPDFQLAVLLTAIGNAGALMFFVYLAPILVTESGFTPAAVPILLMAYGLGAAIGNIVGGRLSDRALFPSLIGLLILLAAVLGTFSLAAGNQLAAVFLVGVTGALAFSVIPGMQTAVLMAAQGAPALGVALNASTFQIAAATAAWLGGSLIEQKWGLLSLPMIGGGITLLGAGLAVVLLLRTTAGRRE
ncbi:MFS transporter [Nitratireductor aestuarii]|uniref:MFS transporter n=1 Tax=Nitratireductor aestuarii TaxID=1735103 RepID=A0A916RC05_9HYPH|nr:MFS transporter [Nitratireductor aestuarii]GGA51267.1 MFS transporter [Nitratireductor aestuarii]